MTGVVMKVAAGDNLRAAVATATDGATLLLAPGVHEAGLGLTRSISIRAEDAVSTDNNAGPDREVILRPSSNGGPVLWVDADGLDVKLEGLRLAGGTSEVGGGVSLRGFSNVVLVRCEVADCRASQGPGDAIWADAGTLTLRDCHLRGQPDREGAVLVVTGVADLHLQGGTIAGHGSDVIRLRDGCEAEIASSSLRNNSGRTALSVAGTRTRAPLVKVVEARLHGTPSLDVKAAYPGKVSVGNTVLSSPARGVFRPLGGVVVRDA